MFSNVLRSVALGGAMCATLFGPDALSMIRDLGARTYDFKDPKGVNGMTFFVDSLVEPIVGTASGVGGTLEFDPTAPEKLQGKIVVETASLKTINPTMSEHLASERWLDAAKYPTIEFVSKGIRNLKSEGAGSWKAEVVGDFSLHGVIKEMTIPVQIAYLEGAQAKRMQGRRGDLVILRTSFNILLKDFAVDGKAPIERVGEMVEIRAAIAGMSK